jgi:hypothetical protein
MPAVGAAVVNAGNPYKASEPARLSASHARNAMRVRGAQERREASTRKAKGIYLDTRTMRGERAPST